MPRTHLCVANGPLRVLARYSRHDSRGLTDNGNWAAHCSVQLDRGHPLRSCHDLCAEPECPMSKDAEACAALGREPCTLGSTCGPCFLGLVAALPGGNFSSVAGDATCVPADGACRGCAGVIFVVSGICSEFAQTTACLPDQVERVTSCGTVIDTTLSGFCHCRTSSGWTQSLWVTSLSPPVLCIRSCRVDMYLPPVTPSAVRAHFDLVLTFSLTGGTCQICDFLGRQPCASGSSRCGSCLPGSIPAHGMTCSGLFRAASAI